MGGGNLLAGTGVIGVHQGAFVVEEDRSDGNSFFSAARAAWARASRIAPRRGDRPPPYTKVSEVIA